MRTWTKTLVLGWLVLGTAGAVAQVSFQTRYISLGTGDTSTAIAADANGNIFVVSQVGTAPNTAIRVTKTDAAGHLVATLDFGSGQVAVAAATVDVQGNLLLAGTFSSGPRTASAYVGKLDNGLKSVVASTMLGHTFISKATAITSDAAGNIYVAGGTSADDFPVTPGVYHYVVSDGHVQFAFVTKLSPDLGQVLLSTTYGELNPNCIFVARQYLPACQASAAQTTVGGIALGLSGAIVIAGATNGWVDPTKYVSFPNSTYSVPYGYIAKFSPDLKSLIASVNFNPAGLSLIGSVAVDRDGSIVVGCRGYPGPFGPTSLQPDPGFMRGNFIVKFDSGLRTQLWGTYFGYGDSASLVDTGIYGITFDPSGRVWFTGRSVVSALPQTTSSSLTRPFIAEISQDGSTLLNLTVSQFGGMAMAAIHGGGIAALGPADAFVVTGPPSQPSMLMVANSANNLSTGTIAPMELLSLFGTGIGPSVPIGGQVENGAFSSTLGGYRVLFNGVAAPLLYAGPNQINVISPAAIAGQPTADIRVEGPGGATVFPTVWVAAARPQLFSTTLAYFPPIWQMTNLAVALNPDGKLNSQANPAPRGSVVSLWATGTGLLNAAQPDGSIVGQTAGLATGVPISVSNAGGPTPLGLVYASQAPNAVVGLTQINIQLPAIEGETMLPPIPGPRGFLVQLQQGGTFSNYVFVYTQ
jgi:uncharacterized protein (TIGR03437 family)